MPRVHLTDVDVTFQVFDADQRSLKRRLIGRGGRHGSDAPGPALSLHPLKKASLTLNAGARVALTGPGNSGKTTALRVIAGLLPPTAGRVLLDGTPGAVFAAGFGLSPAATLDETALAEGLLMGLSLRAARARAEQAIAFAGLSEVRHRPARRCPPEVLTRLGLSCMLALPVDILVLDDCLGTQDAAFCKAVLSALNSPERAQMIVVIADRSADVVSRLCHHTAVLGDGQISPPQPLPAHQAS